MRKLLAVFSTSVLLALCLSGCACEHENVIAASCTKGKVCAECNEVLGEPKPHDFTEATCTEPSRCVDCGEKQSDALGHTLSDTVWTRVDMETATVSKVSPCTACEEDVTIESEEVTSFVEDGKFLFCAAEFADAFEDSSTRVKGYDMGADVVEDDSKSFYDDDYYLFYQIEDNNSSYGSIGMFSFLKGADEYVLYSDNYSTNVFDGILFLIEDASDVSAVLFATILAIDPALDYSEAADFGQSVIDNAGSPEGVTGNGINYVVLQDGGYHYLKVSVA